MKEFSGLDNQFRSLHTEAYHKFEEQQKNNRIEKERLAVLSNKRLERSHEFIKALQVDKKIIDKWEKEDVEDLKAFLEEMRPSLISKDHVVSEHVKQLAMRRNIQSPGQLVTSVYGATLMADDHEDLEGNPGEKGNPWILPFNPGRVKFRRQMWGAGDWGCSFLGGPTYSPANGQIIFWFPFLPDKTGNWYLLSLINLFGFYVLRANDHAWNCKNAQAEINVEVDVLQYFWHGPKRYTILSINEDNINTAQLLTEYGSYDYQATLRAGDWAWMSVTVKLKNYAQGDGSYSETNFSDGSGNYIEPLIVVAIPN